MTDEPYSCVLWVDDDATVLRALQVAFPGGGYAENAYNALTLLHHHVVLGRPWSVLVTDVRMPVMDGVELCARAKTVSPRTRRVLLSAHWGDLDAERAVNEAGASAVLTKPINIEGIARVLDGLISQRRSSDSEPRLYAVDPERERAAALAHDEARHAVLACTEPPKR